MVAIDKYNELFNISIVKDYVGDAAVLDFTDYEWEE